MGTLEPQAPEQAVSVNIRKLIPADKLRMVILDQFYKAWRLRPAGTDYFPVQQVWDQVLKRVGGRVDGPLAEGAINSLLSEGCLAAVKTADGSIAARITDKGRSYREQLVTDRRTGWLAYLGAATGTVSLLWELVTKLFGL